MDKAINLGKNDSNKADKATTPQIITVQNSISNIGAEQLESLRVGDIVKVVSNNIEIYYVATFVSTIQITLYCIYGSMLVLTNVTFMKNGSSWTMYSKQMPLAELTNDVPGSSASVQLEHCGIRNANQMESLTITLPNNIGMEFISQVNFSSGSTATQLTAPNTIVWTGDDLDDGVFVPAANRRYVVMFHSDGKNVRGIVQGIDIIVTP